MGAPKRQILNMKELQEEITSWSDDTIRRRIKDSNFPAMLSPGGEWMFDREAVLDWFHARNVDPAKRIRRKK